MPMIESAANTLRHAWGYSIGGPPGATAPLIIHGYMGSIRTVQLCGAARTRQHWRDIIMAFPSFPICGYCDDESVELGLGRATVAPHAPGYVLDRPGHEYV
eukprot:GHVU01136759.1.p1 GENE.GHVU01136759.1~~GHVU01136759.1.p1  ORF type:complete len:101 (-),score=2.27 GHVU01136759.1:320-622(-)